MTHRILFAAAVLILSYAPAIGQVAMEGTFTASKACPATQSIKSGSNPGSVMTETGKAYRLVGKNKDDATYYFVEVPGAQPLRRWVAVSCGSANGAAQQAAPPAAPKVAPPGPAGNSYVLAMSWQPAFCESRPGKRECRRQTETSFEASHFTLHGLWPQPRRRVFCGVDRALINADNESRWDDLPAVELTPATRASLDEVMPGTLSLLERHEWIKHGTCYPGSGAEQYYKDSIRIMQAINGSKVQELVASRVGRTVSGQEIRQAFDESFGAGAGERVRVACNTDGGRTLITEITIGIRGDVSGGAAVGELVRASSPTDAGCPAGIIDPVGQQ